MGLHWVHLNPPYLNLLAWGILLWKVTCGRGRHAYVVHATHAQVVCSTLCTIGTRPEHMPITMLAGKVKVVMYIMYGFKMSSIPLYCFTVKFRECTLGNCWKLKNKFLNQIFFIGNWWVESFYPKKHQTLRSSVLVILFFGDKERSPSQVMDRVSPFIITILSGQCYGSLVIRDFWYYFLIMYLERLQIVVWLCMRKEE